MSPSPTTLSPVHPNRSTTSRIASPSDTLTRFARSPSTQNGSEEQRPSRRRFIGTDSTPPSADVIEAALDTLEATQHSHTDDTKHPLAPYRKYMVECVICYEPFLQLQRTCICNGAICPECFPRLSSLHCPFCRQIMLCIPEGCVLEYACCKGDLVVLRQRIEAGVEASPLLVEIAAYYGHREILEFLFFVGAPVYANESQCLRNAIQQGHLEIVRFLVLCGADIHAQHGRALRMAVDTGRTDLVALVHEFGVPIAPHYTYCMLRAIAMQNLGIVQYLFRKHPTAHHIPAYVLLDWARSQNRTKTTEDPIVAYLQEAYLERQWKQP